AMSTEIQTRLKLLTEANKGLEQLGANEKDLKGKVAAYDAAANRLQKLVAVLVQQFKDYHDRRDEMLEQVDAEQPKIPEDLRMEFLDLRLNLQFEPRGADVLAEAQHILELSDARMRKWSDGLDAYFNRVNLTRDDEGCRGFVPGAKGEAMPGVKT